MPHLWEFEDWNYCDQMAVKNLEFPTWKAYLEDRKVTKSTWKGAVLAHYWETPITECEDCTDDVWCQGDWCGFCGFSEQFQKPSDVNRLWLTIAFEPGNPSIPYVVLIQDVKREEETEIIGWLSRHYIFHRESVRFILNEK